MKLSKGFLFYFFQEVIMKSLNIIAAALLTFSTGSVVAGSEMSSLVQWEELQTGQKTIASVVSDKDAIKNINSMEATAAGKSQFSSLIQWEESQYADSYAFSGQSDTSIINKINTMDASAAGGKQDELSSLIQWEESF